MTTPHRYHPLPAMLLTLAFAGAAHVALAQSAQPPTASAPAPAAAPAEPPPASRPAEPAAAATDLPGGDREEPLPPELENVGIDEKLNAQLPLDLPFKTHDGRAVTLREFFDGKRPVLLTLNYYKCPMLCGLMLNGVLDALREMDWTIGDQFRVVTISFDPFEQPPMAALKRQNYLQQYGRPPTGTGWEFCTGNQDSIKKILEATGFRIAWNPQRKEWMHAAGIMVCTPDGRLSRYLYGIVFEPKTVRLSLVEASEGKIGSTVDRILLYCYHYEDGEYTLAAMNLVRAGAGLTVLVVGVWLAVLWRRDARRGKAVAAPP